jgi:hypothetical protein
VEIGVLHGEFAEAIERVVCPTQLILIDPWFDYQGHSGEESYATVAARFSRMPHVVLCREYSAAAVPKMPDNSVAFAYVDASHYYEDCLADLEMMLPKMQSGGWLCGHDYFAADGFGVVRATAVFCDRHGLGIALMTDEPAGPWMGATGNQPRCASHNSYGIRIP